VQQIDITVAEALHAGEPAAQMVDPDLDSPVGGILAAWARSIRPASPSNHPST
jgi:hypothetical protein